jgi:hypothetical protein
MAHNLLRAAACSDNGALLHGGTCSTNRHANHSFQLYIFDWLYGYRYNLHACCSALQVRCCVCITQQADPCQPFIPAASLIVAVRLSATLQYCVLVLQRCAAACAVLK